MDVDGAVGEEESVAHVKEGVCAEGCQPRDIP